MNRLEWIWFNRVTYTPRIHNVLFIERSEKDLEEALKGIDRCKLAHSEHHKLEWELQQRNKEITDLQKSLSESQVYLFEERKQLLKVISENDRLKSKSRLEVLYRLHMSIFCRLMRMSWLFVRAIA